MKNTDVEKKEQVSDSNSIYELGVKYYFGISVEKDYDKAANYFQKTVNMGNIKGKYFLGKCYYYGRGIDQDFEKAYKIFDELVHNNEKDLSQNMLVNMCGIMADMLHLGQYVKQDDKMAFEFYKLLAEQYNDKISKFHMAEMYYYGFGVEKKMDEAFRLFKDLADNENYKEAFFYLPEMFFYGRGVEKNIEEAKKYAEVAVENGDNYSAFFLAKISYSNQDYENAAKYFEQALDEKYDDCYYYLGKIYSENLEVNDKEKKAKKFFSKVEKDILSMIFNYVLTVREKDSINSDLILELLNEPYEKFKIIINLLPDENLTKNFSQILSSLTDEQIDEVERNLVEKVRAFSKEHVIRNEFFGEGDLERYILEIIE